MSILIVTVVRSGSSRLLEAVSKAHGKVGILEPTTPGYIADFDPSKDIVKIAVQTLTTSDTLELITKFDETILLDRRDKLAQAISYLNLHTHMKGKHNSKYVSKEFTQEEIDSALQRLEETRQQLIEISKVTSIPIVYLEDLIQFKDIGVEYDKSFFTKELKLRQEKEQLI